MIIFIYDCANFDDSFQIKLEHTNSEILEFQRKETESKIEQLNFALELNHRAMEDFDYVMTRKDDLITNLKLQLATTERETLQLRNEINEILKNGI